MIDIQKITENNRNSANSVISSIELTDIVSAAIEYRYLVAVVTAVCVLIGIISVLTASPNYRADALLQVEEKATGLSAMKEIQPLLEDSTSVTAELEILTSRMVLSKAIGRLNLQIEARPIYFPLIGEPIARRYKGGALKEPVLGLASYPWGGEALKISTLTVPKEFEDELLVLTVLDEKHYALEVRESGEEVLRGIVGERAERNGSAIFVTQLNARPGVKFEIRRVSNDVALAALRKFFSVKEKTKKSGIIEAAVQGPDKAENEKILDEILMAYVRQNVEQRSAEAENTLKFLDGQLPKVKAELDAAEGAYNIYRQSRGSLDLSLETQSVLQSIVEIDNQIVAVKQERDELRQSFTSEHPRVQAVDKRLERLAQRRKEFDKDVTNLPDTQQRVLQLARDVEVYTNLYNNLLNTAQQLRVSKAGTVGDVRIIDAALSAREPTGLKPGVVVAISLVGGLLLSAVLVTIAKALRVVVEDPDVIERELGLPVYATVPLSHEEFSISKVVKKQKGLVTPSLLALSSPDDDAIESLRSLRATIHFVMMDSKRKTLLITGPGPGLGKSFISRNFGAVLAQCGMKVLVIDADLRRGHMHKEFGLNRVMGVAEYVSLGASLGEVIKETVVPNLSVITTGQIPPNPSELLLHSRFAELLEMCEELYDVVIVDAPPILAVADAAIIGKYVGSTLLVVRAGQHPVAELEQSVKRLTQAGVSVRGVIFNCYDVDRQKHRYGYSGYVYRYSYKNK